MSRTGDRIVPLDSSRRLAQDMSGATLVGPGRWTLDTGHFLSEAVRAVRPGHVRSFLGGL